MRNEKIKKFWDGDLKPEQIQQDLTEGSVERDFIESYQNLIERSNAEVPEFDPFAKIEQSKTKKNLFIGRFLPYAATILVLLGFFVVYQNKYSQKSKVVYSEQEVLEIKKNTEMALLHFSKELNACMAKFEDAKQFQQPANEIRQLKNLKIENITH